MVKQFHLQRKLVHLSIKTSEVPSRLGQPRSKRLCLYVQKVASETATAHCYGDTQQQNSVLGGVFNVHFQYVVWPFFDFDMAWTVYFSL